MKNQSMRSVDWKNVFNTTHRQPQNIIDAQKLATEAGYPYLIFGGYIYKTEDLEETGYIAFIDGEIVLQESINWEKYKNV